MTTLGAAATALAAFALAFGSTGCCICAVAELLGADLGEWWPSATLATLATGLLALAVRSIQ